MDSRLSANHDPFKPKLRTIPMTLKHLALTFMLTAASACAAIIYQDDFTNPGTDRGGSYVSSLFGAAPTIRLADPAPGGGAYTTAVWGNGGGWNYGTSSWEGAVAESGGWGQTGDGRATPTSSNYLPFTPVQGAVYTVTATIDTSNWGNGEWFTIGFTSIPNNWVPGNFVANLSEGNLVRGGEANQTISVVLDTTDPGWTNTPGLAYVGWFTDVAGNANLNPGNEEVKITNFSLTTSIPEPATALLAALPMLNLFARRRMS